MAAHVHYALRIAGLFAGMLAPLCAGTFLPPADGPVPFRRDRIPLEASAMSELSTQLVILAREATMTEPAELRRVAQTLALALALDPANHKARALVASCQQDGDQNRGLLNPLDRPRHKITRSLAWLETPAAGTDGAALAACLRDVLSLPAPNQPPGTEQGKWSGWVPELAAYEAQIAKASAPNPNKLAPGPSTQPSREIHLTQAKVHTVLWHKVASNDPVSTWVLAMTPLHMTAKKTDEDKSWKPPLAIALGPPGTEEAFATTNTLLLNLLKKHHDPLPVGYKIFINCPELEQSLPTGQTRKRQSLSAAAAVLASAAVTGHEPEAIILGQVDESGAFKLPTGFWEQLMALGKGTGQRLILPAAAATCVPCMLALERPGFFLEYEVLLAEDFKHLLMLSAKTPDEAQQKIHSQFHEIHDRIGSQDIHQYIANRFVKQRLGEIVQQSPNHFSAKMLLVQASGNRPILVTRPVLAAELQRTLEPLDGLVRTAELVHAPWENGGNGKVTEFTAADQTKMLPSMELCRSRIDALEHYAERKDHDLVDRTRRAITSVRALDKAVRMRGPSYQVSAAVHTACSEFLSAHKQLTEQLATESATP